MNYKIYLKDKIDPIKSNWFLWSCEAEFPDGRLVDGSVQADSSGETIAEETFKQD